MWKRWVLLPALFLGWQWAVDSLPGRQCSNCCFVDPGQNRANLSHSQQAFIEDGIHELSPASNPMWRDTMIEPWDTSDSPNWFGDAVD